MDMNACASAKRKKYPGLNERNDRPLRFIGYKGNQKV